MDDEKMNELVAKVKSKCRITWSDDITDDRIGDIVRNALHVIRYRVGIPDDVDFDFTTPSLEHQILLGYCYYAWHDAEDDFLQHYLQDIYACRMRWEVVGNDEETLSA